MNNKFQPTGNRPRSWIFFLNTKGRLWLAGLSLIIAILVWEIVARVGNFPAFILPSPELVFLRFGQVIVDGTLLRHLAYTLLEIMAGLVLGIIAASTTGYLLAKSPAIERLLSPYIVASQAIPIVAIAPLLIIWFGPGMASKILICALIVFFPVLINTILGLRSVPVELRDLMRSLLASRWQLFRYLEVPAALPVFLGGVRVGATLAVIGAVVGEFVGADRGLGFLVNRARGQYDTALVFVAILTLVGLALVLYGCVTYIEHRLLTWYRQPEEEFANK